MGSDPGTNNLIAKYHANHLDRVDEIALFWVVSIADLEEGATSGAAWDHSLHMNTGKVPQYLDGRLEYVQAGTGEETAEFLEPLGTCQVRYVGHPQPITMPRYIDGVKTVVIKGAMLPAWVDRLIQEQNESGFLSTEPIEIKGTEVAPYDLTLQLWRTIPDNRDNGPMASGMKVIVKGEREGKQVTYTSDIVGRTAPGTGIAASIAALMLHSGDIKVKGVVPPEGCIDPEIYFAALLNRGAKIHQTETIKSLLGS
jgi:saccharopine dehydrogenase (NAD+, L-lysine-forming)